MTTHQLLLPIALAAACSSCCSTQQQLEVADKNITIAMFASAFRSVHGRLPESEAELFEEASPASNRYRAGRFEPLRFQKRRDGSVIVHWRERGAGPFDCRSGHVRLLPNPHRKPAPTQPH